ncbi:MarR family winged helix-turn-helix transcriptional regulator [Frigoribacterium sp. CG_9.8]|uniref:MarR family winged helix-turn-helix transcriptional regulator n=1 Tax=Frigoribacterium sp. CG_9.8 TaxID=2787733 RepID=UPI0018CA584B|nr:MarR family transcriptional regulator [Frigoribacterium sp. CG_9.8]MBG6109132.1 DNA-binding MarR family transcriptional regulator [Frigoribacterium sp. CG_9.8]
MTDPVEMQAWPTGRLLSTAARLVEHAWVEALEQRGLAHAGLIVLHVLGAGALSQTELAKAARVEVQTMSRTLERLEREGYVARRKHPADGRRHVVTRTPAGASAWESARTLEADLFPSISDNVAMRAALLEIIEATAADRWQVE